MRLPGASLAILTFATTYPFRFAGDRVFVRGEQNVGNPDVRVSEFAGTLAPRATRGRRGCRHRNVEHAALNRS